MPQTPEKIIRAFCANVSDRNLKTLEPLLAHDIVFMNVGLEMLRGETVTAEEGFPPGTMDVKPRSE